MAELNRKDLFYIEFPRNFISDSIENFYNPYVKRMPSHIDSTRTLVKSTVQSITIPSFGYDVVSTMYKDKYTPSGITRNDRASFNSQELSDKSITITFNTIDGYINYWVLLDVFFESYDKNNRNPYIFDLPIHILDKDGIIMFSRKFKDCIFSGISEFELSYSDNVALPETFSITINYTTSEINFLQG